MSSGRFAFHRHITLALLLVLVSCRGDGLPDVVSPEDAVKTFYDWRIASRMTGAPTREQLASMRPYISSELHTLLAEARAIHERDLGRAPGEKPAFAEGDLFSSLFEGPTSFTTSDVESMGDEHVVPVRFVYGAKTPAVNWIDRVRVVQENGAYVVADIDYGNHWSFGPKGSLVQSLRRATSNSGKRRA
ncbi:MAG: hypothetical protein ACREV5_22645 [Steroidobacter sp.]